MDKELEYDKVYVYGEEEDADTDPICIKIIGKEEYRNGYKSVGKRYIMSRCNIQGGEYGEKFYWSFDCWKIPGLQTLEEYYDLKMEEKFREIEEYKMKKESLSQEGLV
jgi:hypothetical protein